MQINSTPRQLASSSVLPATESRIIARVVLQAWGGHKGRDLTVIEEKQIDVTETVLQLDYDTVVRLRDHEYQTDAIGRTHVDHSGPLAVNVTRAVCGYFGVEYLTTITPDAFEEARSKVLSLQPPVSSNVAPATENRIIARVVLQVWGGKKGNDAVYDSEKQVDVTDAILLFDHDFVISLEDRSDQTDEIGYQHVNYSGPIEVEVTDSICQFFGVESLEDITLAAFEEARRVVNPKLPEFIRTVVEMEVTAKVLPGGDRSNALENLSIEVSSPSENVIVTCVQRMKPSGDRSLVLAAADPSLPRFMQLMTLSNAVSIDDGALLTDWTRSAWIGEPTNEVLLFSWTDGERDYSAILTEEGIEAGQFDGSGRFHVNDNEGTLMFVRFFKVESIDPSNSTIH